MIQATKYNLGRTREACDCARSVSDGYSSLGVPTSLTPVTVIMYVPTRPFASERRHFIDTVACRSFLCRCPRFR